eukprot:7474920-Pyramimonas_sp.AAC.1
MPSPTAFPPHRSEGNARRVPQDIQDIRSQVANDNIPPNMTWSRLLVPFHLGHSDSRRKSHIRTCV